MLGGHCIKSWAKTQSVIAKSSAESEFYSVVKGATEGLGLITLFGDLGSNMEARLNLDATAAKGILERQGISKVRHIDVNVLWMQQQMASWQQHLGGRSFYMRWGWEWEQWGYDSSSRS